MMNMEVAPGQSDSSGVGGRCTEDKAIEGLERCGI